MSDSDFVLEVLADGEWHSLGEILARSVAERGCGLTVHSRVSDLRVKRGLVIENRVSKNGSGRRDSSYRLLSSAPVVGGGRRFGW